MQSSSDKVGDWRGKKKYRRSERKKDMFLQYKKRQRFAEKARWGQWILDLSYPLMGFLYNVVIFDLT